MLRPEGDPRHFQPSTYFTTAQKMAKTLMADAELVRATFMPVSRDGSVDLTLAAKTDGCNYNGNCGANLYLFRSPSQSRQPGGVPPNVHTLRECGVTVFIYAQSAIYPAFAVASYWATTRCDDRVGPPPRCTLSQVWAAALRQGAPPDAAAKIGWAPGTGWSFSTKLSPGADGFELTLPDNC